MYYAVIGLIRWTRDMLLFRLPLKTLNFHKKEKLRVVQSQNTKNEFNVKQQHSKSLVRCKELGKVLKNKVVKGKKKREMVDNTVKELEEELNNKNDFQK